MRICQELFLEIFRKVVAQMGGPRKIKSAKQMAELWEAFKARCNNRMVLTHDFSSKNSEFVSKELRRSVTYTIEGFCVFAGISRAAFYKNYAGDKRYVDIVTRMKEECEVDAREKFETGQIPTQLAPLWMSKHGYSVKAEQSAAGQSALEQFVQATKPTQAEVEALYAEED
nr:MAG TPA: Terminase small subunit [Caudoviricetes sp.]